MSYYIGVDVGGTNIACGVVDDNCNIIARSKIRTNENSTNGAKPTYEEVFDVPFGSLIKEKKDYTINILNIEREGKKPRKDYAMYSEIKDKINYMYDELFNYDNLELKTSYKKEILKDYIENYYNNKDNEEIWYEKIKKLSLKYGYAKEVKEYKQNPENYKGHVGDVCELIRVSLTSSTKTPDLYQIMNVLGETRVKERMNKFITYLDEKL